jgi:cell fate regulator YaaT (PSP1 superfamily)
MQMVGDEREYRTEVCHGALRHRIACRAAHAGFRGRERCILRTERGVEVGELLRDPEPLAESEEAPTAEVLRPLDSDDERRLAELERKARVEDFEYCLERIEARELPMRLVHVERLFGGGKIIFYFVADGRVDFRDLVKDLARHFHTRIELRQIGVRDEAKILGDQEYCGRELCCMTWMREILPVTMRMAKNQKSTLDPNKISGRCGRLKCCLRFEDEVYQDLRARLPQVGQSVATGRGAGKVLAVDALARSITVQLASRERLTLSVDDVSPAPPEVSQSFEAEEE